MASGGSRNRSGPPPSKDSGRSDRFGFRLTALPAEGYSGTVPDFPLPRPARRELDLWAQAWRTPQACAWSLPSESWRIHTVAMWVRLSYRCEYKGAQASLMGQLHRFADQVGMTTAGLAQMGWEVAVDEVSEKAPAKKAAPRPRRLRAVGDGQ
jgi:hypothetical protein